MRSSSSFRRIKILGTIVLVAFGIYLLQQFQQMQRSIAGIEQSLGGVIDETGKRLKIVDQMEVFGQDLNEIRRFLYLPTKDYNFALSGNSENPIDDETGSGTQLTAQLFQYIDRLGQEQKNKQTVLDLQQQLQTFFQDPATQTLLQEKNATVTPLRETTERYAVDVWLQQSKLVTFAVLKANGHLEQFDFAGRQEFSDWDNFANAMREYLAHLDQRLELQNKVLQNKKNLSDIVSSVPVKTVLTEKHLAYRAPNTIVTQDGAVLFHILVEETTGLYRLEKGNSNQTFSTPEEFTKVLLEQLQMADSSTALEKKIQQVTTELNNAFQDPAFQAVLQSNHLQLETTPVEETDRIYFHLTDQQGMRIGSIVIEKGSGEVQVVDAQGLNGTSLQEAISSDGSKKKP